MATTLLKRFVSRLQSGARPAAADDVAPRPAAASERAAAPAASIAEAKARLDMGDFSGALAVVDRALESDAANAELAFMRASILFSWGRHAEAHASLLRLESSGPRDAAFHVRLGWTRFWLGRLDEADASMRKAVVLAPDDWTTHFGQATVQRARNQTAAAKAGFERALALEPGERHCISNLVLCEVALEHLDAAERYARAALARHPESSSAHIDLGIVLCSEARYSDAVAEFERADALEFSSIDARDESVNYAICLLRAGRPQQAMAMMQTKLRLYPSGALHYHYGLALLTAGRMREGWDHYEFRWLQEPLRSWRPAFLKPVWNGEDLRGKTILLRAEQGYGDFVQFIRYAPSVKALGATVLLEVRPELAALASEAPGIDRVLGSGVPYPDFDCYVNLLSLPRIFGTEVASIPAAVPYLRAPADRVAAWESVIPHDARLNVGLVWAGSPTHLGDRFRSQSLRALAPLRDVEGVRFFSLQKGPASSELVTDSGREPIVDLGPKLATFADTAAAIDRLDLVVSVDTSVVHLAGALAKPIWTLVAIPGDWRWLEARSDTAWYPSMRLFRQRAPGDWGEVLGRLKAALEDEVERFRRTPTPVPAATIVAQPLLRPVVRATASDSRGLCRFAETRHGILMYVPDTPVAASIERYGEHQQIRLDALAALLKPGMTVVEVGADIGVHTVPIASLVGPTGQVFVYEHDPFAKQVLHENLKANRVANVTVMRRSLSGPRTTEADRPGVAPDDQQSFPSETIDDLRLERLDWLMLGRGTEVEPALRGAEATAWRLRPRLFIDIDDDASLASAAKSARDLGYVAWRLETPLFNACNFNRAVENVFGPRTSLTLVAIPEEQDFAPASPAWTRLA